MKISTMLPLISLLSSTMEAASVDAAPLPASVGGSLARGDGKPKIKRKRHNRYGHLTWKESRPENRDMPARVALRSANQ